MLYFTHFSRSPQWMNFYQIWFRGSSRERNKLWQILSQSAQGVWFYWGSKFAFSHWLCRLPLTQCRCYRATCDTSCCCYVWIQLDRSSTECCNSHSEILKRWFCASRLWLHVCRPACTHCSRQQSQLFPSWPAWRLRSHTSHVSVSRSLTVDAVQPAQ